MSTSATTTLIAVLSITVVLGVFTARTACGEPAPGDLDRALEEARAVERDLVETVARVRAAAVTVVGRRAAPRLSREGLVRPLPLGCVGSGVVVAWQGRTWVLTSEHVVAGETHLEAITADGRRHRLRLRATSRGTDLALLAFDRVPEGVRPALLERAVSPDTSEGTWVVATGNPFFLALDGVGVVTLGVVSGTRPPDPEAYLDVSTIQHDAETNPGSSGGALWGLDGALLGINGTIATRSSRQGSGPAHTGASFSVPVAAVYRFLTAALDPPHGVVVPSSGPSAPSTFHSPTDALGVLFRTGRDRSGRPAGAVVVRVDPRGPAASAGLRPGDVLTRLSVAGRTFPVRSATDVGILLRGHPVGRAVSLGFYRAGREYAWSGRLGVR